MLVKLISHMPGRFLVFVPGIALAALMSGCETMDLASVPLKYPISSSPRRYITTTTTAKQAYSNDLARQLDHYEKTSWNHWKPY
jgi:hypothetical protein